jgi:hypothetical protein
MMSVTNVQPGVDPRTVKLSQNHRKRRVRAIQQIRLKTLKTLKTGGFPYFHNRDTEADTGEW